MAGNIVSRAYIDTREKSEKGCDKVAKGGKMLSFYFFLDSCFFIFQSD